MRLIRPILAALMAIAPTACAVPIATVSNDVRLTSPEGYRDDYRLAVGDKVRIAVANEAAFSGEHEVDDAGNITLPLVGAVKVLDKTAPALAGELRETLAREYLKDPAVTVEVAGYRPFVMLGDVAKPAPYPFKVGMTVEQAIAQAGGHTSSADTNTVFIRRSGEDQERPFKLTSTLRVWPGDTIRVPGSLL